MSRSATLATPSHSAFAPVHVNSPFRFLYRYFHAWKIGFDADHLESLPDYLLDDIGLARTEIRTACRTGRRE